MFPNQEIIFISKCLVSIILDTTHGNFKIISVMPLLIANNWFRNNLSERQHFTSTEEISSNKITNTHGVPQQGYILGPLLFLIIASFRFDDGNSNAETIALFWFSSELVPVLQTSLGHEVVEFNLLLQQERLGCKMQISMQ